ncbi:hypothetical protein L226DRAFT_148837 [Lentinus tigrinus ALCF2SS1-7]|uniref:uncharacterized protein n=1 Tax=Lentinus tigrinus ALCF2SS1-7 TaxID=1328758 RepID=UPI001165F87C|nr:hypothetical protein L226DRAFT_148837 [Lentinus tigrinus ALCF2SS1-7]
MDRTQWPCLPGGCAGLNVQKIIEDNGYRVQAGRKAQKSGGGKEKGRGCGEAAAVQAKGLNTLARRPSVPRRPQTRGIPRQPNPRTPLRHGASVPSTTPKSEDRLGRAILFRGTVSGPSSTSLLSVDILRTQAAAACTHTVCIRSRSDPIHRYAALQVAL